MHVHRNLIGLLNDYKPFNDAENRNKIVMLDFLRRTPEAYERTHKFGGHVTSGFFLSNPTRTRVLLNRHKRSGIAANFGGHADGETNVYVTAIKELMEEAAITSPATTGKIFDLDIHFVAAHERKGVMVPNHVHYDVNFLGMVPDDVHYETSDEILEIFWSTLEEFEILNTHSDRDEQLYRFARKVKEGWAAT